MKKELVIFMPSIEGGGVEKNLFIVTNYLAKKINDLTIISISKKYKNKFNRYVNFETLNHDIWDKFSRKFKYFLALILLTRKIFFNKDIVVFAFQANLYCIILCKIFGNKIIVRSNSAPAGWSQNLIKKKNF